LASKAIDWAFDTNLSGGHPLTMENYNKAID